MGPLDFSLNPSAHTMAPEFASASDRNKYEGYLLGLLAVGGGGLGRGAGAYG